MPDLKLPPAMTALRPQLGPVVEVLEARAPYGSVLLSAAQGLRIQVDNREERVTETAPTAGTVVTAFDGVTIHERAVNGFERAAVERAARELVSGLKFARYTPREPEVERRGEFITPMQQPPAELSIPEKLERLRALQRRLKDRDPRIVNARVLYVEKGEASVFRNRKADLAQRVQRGNLYLICVMAGPEGQIRFNSHSIGGTGGWEMFDFTDADIDRLVEYTARQLTAERIEPGEYTIITAPGVSGTICHESFGHGVETDMFLKQRAKAAHFIDKVVGSPLVNIYDDPGLPGGYGAYFFDDEGRLATPTQIVEAGVFRRGITDLYSANALNIARSANGRRQDYTRKTYARMSNTYFGAGTTALPDMVSMVDDGVYLDKWSSGMEDPQGWGIQVTCQYGHEIKHGKITGRMFAPIAVSGYVPEVLQSIRAVGNDLEMDAGGCGKGHKELVAVASGGPHLLMKARLG
jgi:TldD protein